MVDLVTLAFELERRVILFKSATSMPGGGQLGFNGDPNTITPPGTTPGEILLYSCPVGTRYQENDGTQWYKKTMPNVWLEFGAGSTGGMQAYSGTANPNGAFSADFGSVYYDTVHEITYTCISIPSGVDWRVM
jgi:hypothetical protein